jgi:hypothetical protein
MIEVGMIGNEGFAGYPSSSVLVPLLETMVQIPGSALRMQSSALKRKRPGAPHFCDCCFGTSRHSTLRSH